MPMKTIGWSRSGYSSVSRRKSDASPKTTSAIIATTVMIGRRIAKSDMNIGFPVLATGGPEGSEELFDARVDQARFVDAKYGHFVCVLLPDELEHKSRDEDASRDVAVGISAKFARRLSFLDQLGDEGPQQHGPILQPVLVDARHFVRHSSHEERH